MTYDVEMSEAAKDFLRTISMADAKRIGKKIDKLGENPRPQGVEKLSGEENIYRVRSGDYRVLYSIEDEILYVLILKVGHRKRCIENYESCAQAANLGLFASQSRSISSSVSPESISLFIPTAIKHQRQARPSYAKNAMTNSPGMNSRLSYSCLKLRCL
jgi:mRNA interferase RelE/StbE